MTKDYRARLREEWNIILDKVFRKYELIDAAIALNLHTATNKHLADINLLNEKSKHIDAEINSCDEYSIAIEKGEDYI